MVTECSDRLHIGFKVARLKQETVNHNSVVQYSGSIDRIESASDIGGSCLPRTKTISPIALHQSSLLTTDCIL